MLFYENVKHELSHSLKLKRIKSTVEPCYSCTVRDLKPDWDAVLPCSLGEMSISLALSSLDYLNQETEYVPWYAALGEIGYIRNMLLTKPIFGKFEVRSL